MNMVSTITSKGQVTIPNHIRKKVNIKPGDKLFFDVRQIDNQITITPVKLSPLKQVKGVLPKPKGNFKPEEVSWI